MKTAVFFLALFVLSACTTPQRTSAPVDLNANVLYTQATSTAQAEAVRMTQQAMVATKDRAAENAQITMQETAVSGTATRSFSATQSAIVAATATTSAFNREQIELEALTTRRHAETVATVESIAIETTREYTTAQRVKWSRDWGIGILLFGMFLLTIALFVVLYNTGAKIGRVDGELVTIIEQPQKALPEPAPPRPFSVRHRGAFVEVEDTRPPFELTGHDGLLVTKFTSRMLDDMQTNIEKGDRGFRRDSSAHKLGMDKLAGLNGNGYQSVLGAMKLHGYVEREGAGHRWTTHGVSRVLGMDSLPQS